MSGGFVGHAWRDNPLPRYDPAEHTIAEVVSYLEEHPEQRDEILAAEEAGRARTTLLARLR